MNEKVTICGLAGSLRRRSYNAALLRAAQELSPPDLTIVVFDRFAEIPLFNEDVEAQGDPEPVAALKAAIRQADGLLIATPEYNYSVPGVLKNAIDWSSRPPAHSVLKDKPIGIMGATPGMAGTARAQAALRQSFVFTQSPAMLAPEVLVAAAMERFDADGRLIHAPTRDLLGRYLQRLADWVRLFRDRRR